MALLDVNESQLTATNEQGDIIFTITQLPDDVTHLSIHAKTIKPQDIDELPVRLTIGRTWVLDKDASGAFRQYAPKNHHNTKIIYSKLNLLNINNAKE